MAAAAFDIDNADLNPAPAELGLVWHSEKDWKGEMKKKKVNLSINIDGVVLERIQTKKKEVTVGSWDWYHIKSWDVAPTHFAFRTVATKGGPATAYTFETRRAKEIAQKFKDQVSAIMKKKKANKKAAAEGSASLEAQPGGDWDPDALPVIVSRTRIMKVEVTFKPNGLLAPPPQSSLSRNRAPAAASAPPAVQMEDVEVTETDNPMAFLLGILPGGGAAAARPGTPPGDLSQPAPAAAVPVGQSASMADFFSAGVPIGGRGGMQAATGGGSAATLFSLLDEDGSGDGAPAGMPPNAPLLPTGGPAALQPRTVAELQAASGVARAANPFLGMAGVQTQPGTQQPGYPNGYQQQPALNGHPTAGHQQMPQQFGMQRQPGQVNPFAPAAPMQQPGLQPGQRLQPAAQNPFSRLQPYPGSQQQ